MYDIWYSIWLGAPRTSCAGSEKKLNLYLKWDSCSAIQPRRTCRTPNPGLGSGSVRVRDVQEPDRDQFTFESGSFQPGLF